MAKHLVFLEAAVKTLKERGPMSVRDIINNTKNFCGVKFRKAPTPNSLANLLNKDGRFVRIRYDSGRKSLWRVGEEDEVEMAD